jgi:hypothetical protein
LYIVVEDKRERRKTMKLHEIGTEFTMPMKSGGTYHIQFPEEDYLILVAGGNIGTAAEKFDHPNVAVRAPKVFDLKHYQRNRGKWWTTQAGIDFLFVIPKSKIELIEEVGYSYVKVRIGTEKYTISVSGGTFPEEDWTDIVRQGSSIGIKHTLKSLRNLSREAMSPEVCEAKGISLSIPRLDRKTEYMEHASKQEVLDKIKEGDSLVLEKTSYVGQSGNRGPFPIETRNSRRRYFICSSGFGKVKVSYSRVDWVETAKANNIEVTCPETINRIGEVQEPAEK